MNKPVNRKQKTTPRKSKPHTKCQPVPANIPTPQKDKRLSTVDEDCIKESKTSKTDIVKVPSQETYENTRDREAFKCEVERFIEISKYFSNPLRKTASYLSENILVSYPSSFRIEYRRGGVTTEHIKFCNLILEPIYVKLYKVIPELEQVKFINMSLARCKRIPPGLSFNLGFVYDDVNEKPAPNGKMIFVASRKTSTPCYQVCEIELLIEVIKNRRYVTL